ncbi:SelT/SelW/SelH family protein [Caldivirga sp.]|uniref:SelT/SelW/SelH family protein n=1 Tax=Caldivirga sp. TaxID=2080243 RepID=UPI0025BA6F14|nr:Rdx family protein [Caldivirga sp.]
MVSVRVVYCRPCGYLDRAIKLAKDVLSELGYAGVMVTLVPGSNGVFDVYVDDKLVFSRHEEKRFPESSEIIGIIKATVTLAKPT